MNYTTLYGKNLCNLLANKIIEEFNLIDKNHITNIFVVNLGQFIVVKGTTNINNPLNYSQLFTTYCQSELNIDTNFNIIDLIEYNYTLTNQFINIDLSFTKNQILREDMNFKNHGFYDIKLNSDFILHNNQHLFEEITSLPEFNNYNGLKEKDNSVYVSDKIYGMNLVSEKLYHFFLKYISYNVFEKNLCKDINFKLFYTGNINDLNWETMDFEVRSNTLIVSEEWVKSLILDLFDFNYKSIKKHLSLDDYNFSDEIISNDRCWKKRDKVSEMILL